MVLNKIILNSIFAIALISCSNQNEQKHNRDQTILINNNYTSKINNNTPKDTSYLFRITNSKSESGYINSSGDTIIHLGKYLFCYTDTFQNYAKVLSKDQGLIAIDKNENKLFEIYWFDNGPDYTADGLYRIIENDKIGFANDHFEVIIPPQFDCAFPFENGTAKVTYDCKLVPSGEYKVMSSNEWFYIDKKGKLVNNPSETKK